MYVYLYVYMYMYMNLHVCVLILFYVYVYLAPLCVCVPGTCGGQNMALGFLELELTGSCELPRECWDLNLGPVEEQHLSLQSPGL